MSLGKLIYVLRSLHMERIHTDVGKPQNRNVKMTDNVEPEKDSLIDSQIFLTQL